MSFSMFLLTVRTKEFAQKMSIFFTQFTCHIQETKLFKIILYLCDDLNLFRFWLCNLFSCNICYNIIKSLEAEDLQNYKINY